MDVYSGPPCYDDIVSPHTLPKIHRRMPSTIPPTNPSAIVKVETTAQNTSIDCTMNPEYSGPQSPLTESICIQMLNEASFTSTSTNNNTLTGDMDSITEVDNDSVFADGDYDTENNQTVIEREDRENQSDVQCGVRLTSDDEGKELSVITDKSQLNALLNQQQNQQKTSKVSGSKQINMKQADGDTGKSDIHPQELSVTQNNGKINPGFLHDQVLTIPLQINDAYPTKPVKSEDHCIVNCKGEKFSTGILPPKTVFPMFYKKEALEAEPRPKDYILFSCLVLVCCCNPLALLSFLLSVNVNSAYDKGKYNRARKYSKASFWLSTFCVFLTIAVALAILIIFWPEHSWRKMPDQEYN